IEDGEDEKEIKMHKQGERISLPLQLKKDFLNKKGEICMDKVKNNLWESFDEDNIKRAYMLLAFQYIICPPSHGPLPLSCLHLVEDVSALNKKRWATFVINSLVKGIEKYNISKGNTERPIGGCLLLLQLYATKGSITTPLKCDKRGKKTRDKVSKCEM
ncbi:hypothetical protein Tco_0137424, partial [Tanacetum coccineum]